MKLATVLTPLDAENLQLAAQCGVEAVVARYPGSSLNALLEVKARIEQHGLQLAAIEGYLPIEKIKVGADHDGAEVDAMCELISNMGQAGIPLACYNFMAGTDWVRTRLDAPERGGARVTAFSLQDAEHAISLNSDQQERSAPISATQLWDNLERFVERLLPVAESAGVTMAMHPDDPPLDSFAGLARIMNSVESFRRFLSLSDSPHHAICFCQGTFATMGVDISATIRELGPRIAYVHFRDARGTANAFVETFHDNGPTDMADSIATLRDIGFRGPIRPDHVPQLLGEEDGEAGYTMLGRLFAFGYIRGLLDATKAS